jgi:hypothetical protein
VGGKRQHAQQRGSRAGGDLLLILDLCRAWAMASTGKENWKSFSGWSPSTNVLFYCQRLPPCGNASNCLEILKCKETFQCSDRKIFSAFPRCSMACKTKIIGKHPSGCSPCLPNRPPLHVLSSMVCSDNKPLQFLNNWVDEPNFGIRQTGIQFFPKLCDSG